MVIDFCLREGLSMVLLPADAAEVVKTAQISGGRIGGSQNPRILIHKWCSFFGAFSPSYYLLLFNVTPPCPFFNSSPAF